MGVNKYLPHVLVVPEDDANREMANGFALHPAVAGTRIEVRPPAGGWTRVLDEFESVYLPTLHKYSMRHLVLLLDFDDQVDGRAAAVRQRIPDDVHGRVCTMGVRNHPERLRGALHASLEKIGGALAEACASQAKGHWAHDLLQHNQPEIDRASAVFRSILFT